MKNKATSSSANEPLSVETLLGKAILTGLDGNGGWRVSMACASAGESVEILTVSVESESAKPSVPPCFSVRFRAPIRAAATCWTPQHLHFEMPLPWTQARIGANSARDLPLYANVGPDGQTRLVLAVSEIERRVSINGVIDEFGADEPIAVSFFTEPEDPLLRYRVQIRIDTGIRPFYQAMQEASLWLDGFAASQALAPIPEEVLRPWYSTWYSYHHKLSPEAVIAEARAAKRLGMKGLLLDSGWDFRTRSHGLPPESPSAVGDWILDSGKIPDMAALARVVHAEGLKFVLWFALPFVGEHSKAWKKWNDKFLWIRKWGDQQFGILDPRFPEVREHLAKLFGRAMREWGLDGLKLDFIDSMEPRKFAPAAAPGAEAAPNLPSATNTGCDGEVAEGAGELIGGRDFTSVPQAVVALVKEISASIRSVKPDAIVEFRQGYVGPLIRRFATMLRASDCPSSIVTNRIKTVDLRLTSVDTPVHGDMLEWDLNGTAEEAALQWLATLFAVPQISMKLASLPSRHRATLRFWLRFWNTHRDTLVKAPFRPLHPQAAYPVVAAAGKAETVTAIYQGGVVADVWQDSATVGYVVNASCTQVLQLRFSKKPTSVEVFDCTGKSVAVSTPCHKGLCEVSVPPSGLLVAKA